MNKWTIGLTALFIGTSVYAVWPLPSSGSERLIVAASASTALSQEAVPQEAPASGEPLAAQPERQQAQAAGDSQAAAAPSTMPGTAGQAAPGQAAPQQQQTASPSSAVPQPASAQTGANGQSPASSQPGSNGQPSSSTQPNSSAPASPGTSAKPATLEEAVNGWKTSLAKEKGFEAWQKATWNSYPLGPGTHGWVVLLKNGSDEVGYMIIHATDDNGFRLSEYGTGKSPMFSLATLHRTMEKEGLTKLPYKAFSEKPELHGTRLYFNPMQAVWSVTTGGNTYLIDAKTGELLPVRPNVLPSEILAQDKGTKFDSPHTIMERQQFPSFDAFDKLPWVKGKPLEIQAFSELKDQLNEQQKLTYVAYLYGYQVTVPLAVIGYHSWTSANYMLLEQNGLRAVSYDALPTSGRFYR